MTKKSKQENVVFTSERPVSKKKTLMKKSSTKKGAPKQKTKTKKQFPSISHVFPEGVRIWWQAYGKAAYAARLALLIVILLICLAVTNIYTLLAKRDMLWQQQTRSEQESGYWQDVVKHYPSYRDGYVMLALAEYRRGEKAKAKTNVEKALSLDPNNEKLQQFLQELE